MAIVSDPIPTPASVRFTFSFTPPTVGVVDKYAFTIYKNGVAINFPLNGADGTNKEVPATTTSVALNIAVVNGDVISIRVAPINASGRGATVEETLLVDWLPSLPGDMVVTITH